MKTPVAILTEEDVRRCAKMDEAALAAVEKAFVWLSEDKVEMPPIMHVGVTEHDGDVDIKSAYVKGQPSIAVKVAAGFFGNMKQGLPNSSGMVVVVSAKTGRCEAVILDNCYLTDLRTGLAGAVAAQQLARSDARVLGVIGAGVQARFQAEAFALVRPLSKIIVAARAQDQLDAYKREMAEKLGVEVETTSSIEHAVRGSDAIVTTTPSKAPLIKAEWLRAGQHITAMGSDLPGKQELDPAILTRADVVVADKPEQSRTHGELQHLNDEAAVQVTVQSLGDVIRGDGAGRTSQDHITVCDLSGIGVQDTAIALHVLQSAEAQGLGHLFHT
ncbi:MAG: ornithine cyclodeaminase family protein [Pseudomonadota bacterium]